MEGRNIMATTYQLLTLTAVSAFLLFFIHWIYEVFVEICLPQYNTAGLDISEKHLKSVPICSRVPKALEQKNSVMRQAPFPYWNTNIEAKAYYIPLYLLEVYAAAFSDKILCHKKKCYRPWPAG